MSYKKAFYFFLILVLVFSIFIRFANTSNQFVWFDESIYLVGALKFHHGSNDDPRLWNYEHPPFSKWIAGILTIGNKSDYSSIIKVPMQKYIYTFEAFKPVKDNLFAMRTVSVLFGLAVLLLVFLITRKLFDKKTALISTALAGISFPLVIYSRILFLDIYVLTFILSSIYFYIKFIKNEEKRMTNLTLTAFSIFFAFASKNPLPFILVTAIILLHYYYAKNKKELLFFYVLLIVLLGIFFGLIYPIFSLRTEKVFEYTTGKLIGVSGINENISLPEKISNMITGRINTFIIILENLAVWSSFALMFALLLSFFVLLKSNLKEKVKKIFEKKTIKNILNNNSVIKPEKMFICAFFIIFLVILIIGKIGLNHSLPLIVLITIFSAKAVEKTSSSKIVTALFVLFIVIDMASLGIAFTQQLNEKKNAFTFRQMDRSDYYDAIPQTNEMIKFLEKENRPVISNNINVLMFFNGKKEAWPEKNSEKCSDFYFRELEKEKYLIAFKGDITKENEYICSLPEEKLKLVKEFIHNKSNEKEKLAVYEIKSNKQI